MQASALAQIPTLIANLIVGKYMGLCQRVKIDRGSWLLRLL